MSAAAVVEQSIATFALHALWQVPLLAGAAWCAVRIGRPQARIAHLLWVATLLACVVLPVCSTVSARRAALAAERSAQVTVSYDELALQGDLQPMLRQPAWKRMLHRHLSLHDGVQPFAFGLPQRWARLIAGAWLLAVAFFSMQFAIGWMRIRALVRAATDDQLPPSIAFALRQQCERLHMTEPATKLHAGLAGPVLAGVAPPTLLLPGDSVHEMGAAEIEAVLAHELAHLRRRDPVVHAVCSLLLLPIAFHPAALWAARSVRQTREMACDAEAAERMGSPADYAWALLRVAERTSTGRGYAAAGFFSNGLFGAGLQLFTNRGAMEERMQMLMNENGSKVRGRAVRVVAGVSLAGVAIAAATMLQIQPTLAAERSLPQAAATQLAPPAQRANATLPDQDNEPALIGGEHAREQLRRAQRQLRQAESQATSDEDRRKIEGAQQAVAVAQQALSAADPSSSPRVHVDLSGLDHLNVQVNSPEWKAQLEKQHEAMAKLRAQFDSPEWKAQMQHLQTQAAEFARTQVNSPEFKAQMDKQREDTKKLQAQMNSPEFKAQMEAARHIDRAKIDALMADARVQQEKAMEQFRSGAMQRQIDQARLMARVDPAPMMPMPAPVPSPSPAADQGNGDKPIKISPGVMQGNKISGANPAYPPDAREKRIQGTVVLHAIIDATGKVEAVQVVSSPDDSLSKSAVAAVQTWVYKPYLLNGDPIAVDTTVNVNFSLMP